MKASNNRNLNARRAFGYVIIGGKILKNKSRIKNLALLMAAVFALGMLAACGGSTSSQAPAAESTAPQSQATGSTAAAPTEAKDKYVIGFSQTGTESEWVVAMSDEILASFAESDMLELQFAESQAIQENQIKTLRAYIQQGVDAIVLRPTVTTGWDTVLMEAKEAGIPVILAGRRVEMATGNIEDYTMTFVGPDNVQAGEALANTMLDMLADEEAPVNVVIMEGTVGASAATERQTGIMNVLDGQDKVVVYGSQSAEWTRTKGKEVMEAFLKSAQAEGVEIKGVLAHNDDMALGAIQAIEEAGMKPGEDILLMGVDGAHGAFEAMVEGTYNATVENPLGYGPVLVDLFEAYFTDGTVPGPWVVLDNVVYTQDQAAAALPNRTW